MRRIVLDTNCLLMSIPKRSPYRMVWDAFLSGQFILCVTNEILEEYHEIIAQKTNSTIANNVVSTILNQFNTELITPYYHFELIQADKDDNKFVDCAIVAGAEYIVTNDLHFNILNQISFPKVYIIQLKTFSYLLNRYNIEDENQRVINEGNIEYISLPTSQNND